MNTQISEFIRDPEAHRLFQQERLILDVTERVCQEMENGGMNRVQLANALGKSKGYVSQLLDGSANMTLRTLSDVFLAMGLAACIHAQPLQSRAAHMTLVHDDDEVSWAWHNQSESDVAQHAPHSIPVGCLDGDGMAA